MGTLLSQKQIGHWSFQNRIVMPALVRFAINGQDGYVNDQSIAHYLDSSQSNGLTFVEASAVSAKAKIHPHMLGIWCDAQIPGMRRLVEAIHSNGSVAILQLNYAGIVSKDLFSEPLAPSMEYHERIRLSRAMTAEDIANVKHMFVDATLRAQKAGFDGVELHAAHGYLFCRFLDTVCNRRTDRYSGNNAESRTRFLGETIAAIRDAVGNSMLLSVRVGCNAPDFNTARENVLKISEMPIDLLHFSYGVIEPAPDPTVPKDFPCNTVVYYGTKLASLVSIPTILSNGIRTPAQAQYLIQNGLCDFVAIGRGFLADPLWAQKVVSNRSNEIELCCHCKECFWRTDLNKCPATRRRLQGTP